jgi:hypothetical protein
LFELVPGDLLTTYLSITDPPFDAGAVIATVADVGVIPVTEATVGAPGTVGVSVVIETDEAEATDLPPAYASMFPLAACAILCATTLN